MTTIILPKLNEKDVAEVPKDALNGLVLHFVSRVEEVFELALEPKAIRKGRAEVVRTGYRSARRKILKSKAKSKSSRPKSNQPRV